MQFTDLKILLKESCMTTYCAGVSTYVDVMKKTPKFKQK
jgi:hypothetical protein